MAYKNNLLEYYSGGSVPNRQGYQGGGVAEEETGEVSPWFPEGQFLGYDVPSGTGNIVDILTSLAIGGGSRRLAGIAGKALRPTKELTRKEIGENFRNLMAEYRNTAGTIHGNPIFMQSPKLPKKLPSKRVLAEMEADPRWKSFMSQKLLQNTTYKTRPAIAPSLERKLMEHKTYRDMMEEGFKPRAISSKTWDKVESPYKNINYDKFKEVLAKPHKEGAPNFPLAILKAYMGEDEEGYQKGGEVSYMQGGGLINRAIRIRDSVEDVKNRAQKIKKKMGLSKILGTLGEWGGRAVGTYFGGEAGGTFGAGAGRGYGAKLGYGDKVGSGLDKTSWLAPARKQLGKAEEGLDKSFLEQGIAAGLSEGFESGAFKDLGANIKEKLNWKPDTGITPMNAPSSYKARTLQRTHSPLKVEYEGLGAMNIAQKPRAFGGSLLGFNPEAEASAWQGSTLDVSPPNLQDITPYSPPPMLSASNIGNTTANIGNTTAKYKLPYEDVLGSSWKDLDPDTSVLGALGYGDDNFQEGGAVRDDLALLDMILHRR